MLFQQSFVCDSPTESVIKTVLERSKIELALRYKASCLFF